VGEENAGAQQAKQGRCFEHGVYSRTEGTEIEAEMGSSKRESEAKQAPQQDHTEAGYADRCRADAALNECRHGFRSPMINGYGAFLPGAPGNIPDKAGQGLLTWSASPSIDRGEANGAAFRLDVGAPGKWFRRDRFLFRAEPLPAQCRRCRGSVALRRSRKEAFRAIAMDWA
jgi:hypothetical protein